MPLLRTLRALGVSGRALVTAMLIELAVFTLFAGGAGVIGGYLIAAALLPDVAASLEGLYGAQISGTLALDARWMISALAMAGGGALFDLGVYNVTSLCALFGPARRVSSDLGRPGVRAGVPARRTRRGR